MVPTNVKTVIINPPYSISRATSIDWFISTPLARRRSSCPPPSPNLVSTHPIERYQVLRDSVPCLSRAATPSEGHHGARKRRASGNAILSQPCRRRVSTDRLNREGSQLAASLEGEPGPTPAEKALPHSYPETRIRRERARGRISLAGVYQMKKRRNKMVHSADCTSCSEDDDLNPVRIPSFLQIADAVVHTPNTVQYNSTLDCRDAGRVFRLPLLPAGCT